MRYVQRKKRSSKGKGRSGGMLVHKYYTDDDMYHASYGKDKNKTDRSFKTLKAAKVYLKKHHASVNRFSD